jgi:hypothetical protein
MGATRTVNGCDKNAAKNDTLARNLQKSSGRLIDEKRAVARVDRQHMTGDVLYLIEEGSALPF